MSQVSAKQSKFLSLLLRHKPETIGLILDENGWADIDELIEKSRKAGVHFDFHLIQEIVETNDKKRFALSHDGRRIRANQGHSINVELNLAEALPPDVLYHGTAERFLDAIKRDGLCKMQRHHVHLSEKITVAKQVGSRYGKLVLLSVDARSMVHDGITFFCSENNVWLVDHVPVKYLTVMTEVGES